VAGILFIDAEQPFADQMVGALKGKGFSVKLLDDGKDGLDLAKTDKPDLIVLCVELPKMSGYSICNKLKKDNDLKSIPLIITSKEATPETFAQHKKLKTRAEDYLIKPFSEGELVEKIGAFISLPAAGAAASNGAKSGGDDAFDALESLGADLDLSSSSGENDVKLDDADFASLDATSPSPPPSGAKAPDGLGLSPEDDALLASLDDMGLDDAKAGRNESAAPSAIPGLDDELEMGGNVKADGLDDLETGIDALGSLDEPAPAPAKSAPPPIPSRAEKPAPAAAVSMTPVSVTPQAAGMSAAEQQQMAQLRRDNSDMKAKVAELEARLKGAEEATKAKDAQLAAASSGGGSGGGSSAREVLNLKEQLRAKEKEIGQLKDEVFEKEKGNVELQEQMEQVRAETDKKLEAAKQKDVEISALNAKLTAMTEERDEAEQQAQQARQQADQDKAALRAEVDQAKAEANKLKGDMDRARAFEDKLKSDLERAKSETENEKKAHAATKSTLEGKIKDAENEARSQEERALKAFQRLKADEAVREKAKQAVEIAFRLLSGEVESGKKSSESVDLELDAE
jgi:DNA-binding response OmpR family regulator